MKDLFYKHREATRTKTSKEILESYKNNPYFIHLRDLPKGVRWLYKDDKINPDDRIFYRLHYRYGDRTFNEKTDYSFIVKTDFFKEVSVDGLKESTWLKDLDHHEFMIFKVTQFK